MKLKSITGILFAGFVITLFSACGASSQKAQQKTTDTPTVSEIYVKSETIQTEEIYDSISSSGRLAGNKDIMIMPQIPGEIEDILVSVNDRVSKDDLLVKMNAASLEQVEAQYEAARKSYERMKSLYADKLIAPQEYDQVKAGYDTAKAAYRQVLDSTELTAPFQGTIVGKYFDENELYSPGRRGILRLAQIEKLKLPITVVAKDYVKLSEGMEARIVVEAFPDQVFYGVLRDLSPGADPVTGLFSAHIIMDNPDNRLPVGVFATGYVIIRINKNALVIPRTALLADSVVFTLESGRAKHRVVQTGILLADKVEITGGLNEGDTIISEGTLGLEDGMAVKVIGR
ncbi:MAG: efflux RND transporter periplasmic adaptor subunit [Spirochaetaceae bacterium]|nr:efflux RND transporter periplasmic adaptor subunit [Spirochaetaceae bacterium]